MSENFFCLPVEQQLTSHISLRQLDELPIVVINHPDFRAAIALQGAHLLSWQPVDQQPVIWLSDKALFKKGQAIRGGVPICWPWFGKIATPSHGFVRNIPWQLTEYKEDSDKINLFFELEDDASTREIWPHAFRLINHISLSKNQLDIQLSSFGHFDITTALHTYLSVGDISHTFVNGLGKHYFDSLTKTHIEKDEVELSIHAEIDRIYNQPSAITLVSDNDQQRNLILTHNNHQDIVVWNPFDKAKQMTDMDTNGYKTMLCVETACVSHPLHATEDKPAVLGMTIRIENN